MECTQHQSIKITTMASPTRRHRHRRRQSTRCCRSCRSIYHCTAFILSISSSLNSSSVDAFSLVQNAAATSSTAQQSTSPSSDASAQQTVVVGATTNAASNSNSGSAGISSSSLHHKRGASATAAASSSNNLNNPFRGALTTSGSASNNRRHHRHRNPRQYQPPHPTSLAGSSGQQGSSSSSSSSFTDDFALRLDMMAEHWDENHEDDNYSSNSIQEHDELSSSSEAHHCNNNGRPSTSSSVSSSPYFYDDETVSSSMSMSMIDQPETQQLYERRAFLHGMLSATATAVVATAATTTTTTTNTNSVGFTSLLPWSPIEPAFAYEQSYPLELQMTPVGEVENSSNSLTKLNEERLSYKKAKVKATQMELHTDPLGVVPTTIHDMEVTIAGAFTWGLALWLALGSRSNPIVTPLANVLYGGNNANVDGDDESNQSNDGSILSSSSSNNNKSENQWLTDRNDGFFGELPPSFMAVLSVVFVLFGIVLDRTVYFLADGDAEVSLQLGGVSVIGGAVWEVGRLAAKEKAPTREEYERDVELYREFREFAEKRIIVGGRSNGAGGSNSGGRSLSSCSCHRSDVISAFRRYNPKYRTADNEQFPLSDIEIERILRKWNREFGSGSEMSSAGFFAGICVDGVADAFAPR